VALLIGNGNYPDAPLRNPVKIAMKLLEKTYVGMTVETLNNNKLATIPLGNGVFKR